MEKSELYKLPKDILIKIITEIYEENRKMESIFWNLIDTKHELSLNEFHKQLIIKLSHVIGNYFEKNDPEDLRFYERPEDCFDGICMDSDHMFKFMDSIIMEGKDTFDKFCNNPFDGDIMNYLRRDISCGNSTCLYLVPLSENRWTGYHPSIDFLNEIFDIMLT